MKTMLDDCWHHYNDCLGFELTKTQFKTLLKEDDYTRAEIETGMGCDTNVVEGFMHFIGMKITGLEWPCGGTSLEEKEKFVSKMKVKGRAMGYNIPDDWGLR